MKYVWVGILIAAMARGLPVARAQCGGNNPIYEIKVYDEPYTGGDTLSYQIYLKDGEYYLAVSDVSARWEEVISSLEVWDNYPPHWWIYYNGDCDTGALWDDGDGALDYVGDDFNDHVYSLKWRCPSNRDRTYMVFCEHEDGGGDGHPLHLYKHGNADEVVIEMSQLDRWNDKIQRIDTNEYNTPDRHYYWYFYKDKNFQKKKLTLSDADPDRDNVGSLKITSFRLVITDSDTAPALAGPVPTLSEWGMVALALLLLASGAGIMWRRRTMTNRSCPN